MNVNMQKNNFRQIRKKWKKPLIVTIKADELKRHIQVAAYSGVDCKSSHYR